MNATAHECRQYDDDWHPCPFPKTSKAASFNYRGRGWSASDVHDDDSCSITYADSTGNLHLIGCIVHCSAAAFLTCYFANEFRKSRARSRAMISQPRLRAATPKAVALSYAVRIVAMARDACSRTNTAGPRLQDTLWFR